MFQVGDKVVHPMHGAGIVEAIVKRKTEGVCREYYVLKLPIGGMVVMVPVDTSAELGMRPVMDAAEVEAVVAALPTLELEPISNWNLRFRDNMDRIKSGDLLEVARVVRGLCRRDAVRGLSTGERKLLHSAKQILASEIALAQGSTYWEAERRINSLLEQ